MQSSQNNTKTKQTQEKQNNLVAFMPEEAKQALISIISFCPNKHERAAILHRITTQLLQYAIILRDTEIQTPETVDYDDVIFLNMLSDFICNVDELIKN